MFLSFISAMYTTAIHIETNVKKYTWFAPLCSCTKIVAAWVMAATKLQADIKNFFVEHDLF